MLLRYILSTTFLCFLVSSFVQGQGRITGQLSASDSKEAIGFAHVFLFSDSSATAPIAQTYADAFGQFMFDKLPYGRYTLRATAVGQLPLERQGLELSESTPSWALGTLLVQGDIQALSEITITSGIGVTEITPGKVVFAAADLPVAQGGTAGDMLKLMPSVSMGGPPGVPRDVRYRGLEKAYTLVLINGKNVGIQGNNRETIVNQIPASAVERIEIIANPGPQYDGDGISGVVNIILKNQYRFGTHGHAEVFYDNRGGYNLSAQAAHKFKKGEVSVNYDHNQVYFKDDFAIVETESQTLFRNDVLDGYRRVNAREMRDLRSENLKVGARFYPSKQSVLSASYLWGSQIEARNKLTDTRNLRADESFRDRTLRDEQRTENLQFHQYNLDYKLNFRKGGFLELYGNYVRSPQTKPRLQTDQRLTDGGEPLNNTPGIQRNTENFADNNFFAQAMVFRPITQKYALRGGYKLLHRNREAFQLIERFNYNTDSFDERLDGGKNFNYTETIHAFFINNEWNIGRLRAELGYRHEYTQYNSVATVSQIQTRNSYHLPLPVLNAYYNIDSTQYLKLSVARRIRRPAMEQLNPFEDNSDPTKIKTGNPNLLPETAWAYEIGYMKRFKFWELGANLFRRDLSNIIQKEVIDLEPGVILERQANFGGAYIQGLELLTAIRPLEWVNLNLNYGRFASGLKDAEGAGSLQDQFDWSFKFIGDLHWQRAGLMLQAAYNVIGPKNSFDRTENTIEFWDFALTKSFLDKKAFFVLRIVDAFATNRKVRTETTAAVLRERIQQAPGRLLSAGLSYRF